MQDNKPEVKPIVPLTPPQPPPKAAEPPPEVKVTLYARDGQPMKVWQGRFKVGIVDGFVAFNVDGRQVLVSGTIVVE